MLPDFATSRGKRVALIITRSNELKFVRPKAIHQRLFWVSDMGLYQFNEDYMYQHHRSPWYLFDASCTNPVSARAVLELNTYLESKGKPHMTIDEIAKHVYHIRYLDEFERTLAGWVQKLRDEGTAERDLYEAFANGDLERSAKKLYDLHVRQEAGKVFDKLSADDFSEHTRKWLNDFMNEDVVARNYLFQRIMIEQKFRMWASLPIVDLNFMQKTFQKKFAAYIIRDNRVIDLDLNVDVRKDLATGKHMIVTKEFDDIELKSQRAVFRHGRTRVFFIMAWSKSVQDNAPQLLQSTMQAKPTLVTAEARALV